MLSNAPATLEHLKEARAVFEMEMARIAASVRTQADIDRLSRLLEKQEKARRDPPLFVEMDGAFHREISAIGGNPIFVAISESVFRWLSEFHVDLVRFPGLEELTIKEHTAILNAIIEKNPDNAAKAMGDHLFRANKLYRQQEGVA